ncbi:aminotransferase class V-fold PLP-dependent enzyme [Caloramator proteoclasticus]|uniref:Selenocysteine lyase/Cysteine desulfurase n=1 Tax=Caloramator proteoclasticus DSM 10124 TaxID=1121262 RepID=A0A1M5B8B4_9CLOT|nr:aminotransferase class V-fold PLP-dependent enzyme [Caloramator proteoclasticus]SHF38646.1 Selenocysteine lyase/Cysteine desulfurase [Caloramator proteoclasticus DSM 10124]
MDSFRDLVVGVESFVPLKDGSFIKYINFDNAATTPPFKNVMWFINYFSEYYSSIHRGEGYKSRVSTEIYESAREDIINFIGGSKEDTVIFVKNTTEAINKLSFKICSQYPNCVVLTTEMEHHSNLLPWRFRFHIDTVRTDSCGRIDLENLEKKLKSYYGMVKLVAITYASNVTGYINPVHEIAALCHKYGAKIFVDCAQIIAHKKISMKNEDERKNLDFIAFSAHKMYAPFGIGVLVGDKNSLSSGIPDIKGGGTVKVVTDDFVVWDDLPHKEEGGTPNVMGVAALISAINTLNYIGLDKVEEYEKRLLKYASEALKDVKDIRFYCDGIEDKVAIIPFNIEGVNHNDVARILSEEYGIGVRNGCFCAQPYVHKLLNLNRSDIKNIIRDSDITKRPGLVRLSFALYNTFEEIDRLKFALEEIVKKYSSI